MGDRVLGSIQEIKRLKSLFSSSDPKVLGRLAKNHRSFSPKENGELILRVNEPKLNSKKVYGNNFGVLKLTIEAN